LDKLPFLVWVRIGADEEGCLPFQFQPAALHGTIAVKGLVAGEIEHGQVTAAERMQVIHGVPHRARRQRLVGSHALRETSAFRNEEAEAMHQFGPAKIVRLLFSPREDLPISALSDPCLLVLAEGEAC
jgi:hypothetical protein